MKMLIVLILPVPLLVISCASRSTPPVVVAPLPAAVVSPVESVRHVEIVRAYHLGRYMDPNQPGVMHEQHPVYRVEAESRWNLLPGQDYSGKGTATNPPKPVFDSAFLDQRCFQQVMKTQFALGTTFSWVVRRGLPHGRG